MLQLLLDVTTAANQAPTLRDALPLAIDCVRAHTDWPLGHAYLLDSDGALVSTGYWSSNDIDAFRALRECTTSMRFAPGTGLPGRVLATGRAEAITDVTSDSGFLRAATAVDLGVRAAFAFPVRTGDEIVGVLEFFSRRSVDLDRSFLDVMEHVGTQLGRVVDRERAKIAAFEARERAVESARLQDSFLRMVSHDLRNPLHTIGLAASLLQDVPLTEQQQQNQIALIRRAVDHMRRLVDDLVDLERINAGHGLKIEPRPLEPHRLLDDVCQLVEPQARAKNITISRHDPQPLPPIHADPERVLQVFWNLIGNAIKHTPAGGTIIISAEPSADAVLFAVTDTGPGIAADDVPKLFDAYWQSKKAGRVGAGLGLPISRGIVESHAGRIWVETERGRGSSFQFTLPHFRSHD